MSTLRNAAERYLDLRRSLGFKLESQAFTLRNFLRFAEREAAKTITTELVLRWSKQPCRAGPATWAQRLGVVRNFAAWYAAYDANCEIPPEGLISQRFRRQQPYIYSDHEIDQILRAAADLPSRLGLRGSTCSTIYALLAATGMRVGEALALDRSDVDLESGVLTIRNAKFGKSRLVPLHATTKRALAQYAARRDRALRRASPPFFVSDSGQRITQWCVRYNFARISQRVGIRIPALGLRHGRGPRLHDLRHRFAVRTMIAWYRCGANVEAEMPRLATYLGHVHVNETYWYIEGVPELLQLATERLQRSSRGTRP